jgi:hypothetical protein
VVRKTEIEEKVKENNIIHDTLMRNKEAVADEAKKILQEEGSIRDDEKIIQCLANDCNAL